MCIKYNEGISSIGGGVDFRNAYLKYKQYFKNAGFEVGTWGYNYSENLKDTFPNIDIKFINKIRNSILNEKVEITNELYLRAYAEAGLYEG